MGAMTGYLQTFGFGPHGWGPAMLLATGMTLAVALCGFLVGLFFGALGAWAKLSGSSLAGAITDAYTTVLRGVPELLVIYVFYFGGSVVLSAVAHWFGGQGFFGLPAFATGALAIGIVSGAYQTEVFRGAYQAISRGEIEAAQAVGMSRGLMLRRIIVPLALRHAIPGIGNVWQLVLKESALISVTGLVELLRQAQVGAGSTRQPFSFYIAAATLYLLVATISGRGFRQAERHSMRGVRRA